MTTAAGPGRHQERVRHRLPPRRHRGLSPAHCRHTFATWHYQEHRDLNALMEIGGWKSIKMVMRYAHANVDQHLASVDALPGGKLGECEIAKPKTAKRSRA